jgi:hypothetical protein
MLVFIVLVVTLFPIIGSIYSVDIVQNILFISLALYFREDKNLLTLLVVILIGRLFFELTWLIESYHASLGLTLYIFTGTVFFFLRHDKLAKFALTLLFCVVVAELYWWLTDYDEKPSLSFYLTVITGDLAVRHFILIRPDFFRKYSIKLQRVSIDWHLYHLFGLFVLAVAALVIEYFVRHILGIQTFVIYNVYPYIMTTINAVILWVILNYALKKTALFQA